MTRIGASIVLAVVGLQVPLAHAEPVQCQKQVVKALLRFKKTYLKSLVKCVDAENLGKIGGPCPDATADAKIDAVKLKTRTKIELSCPDPDLATLGFPSTCAYEATPTGIENTCGALPVGTPGEFADCLMCWKGAELSELVATLYASHASEICGGALDETSPACSELDCATPLPTQHDLGDSGENDCQRAIGKAGVKHLVSIEKALEKCGLLGNDRATCVVDSIVQEALERADLKLETAVKNKCGNRDPLPDPPFCCRTGVANQCVAAASRDDCLMTEGQFVQENKTCGLGGSCDPTGGGGQKITWWSTCPRSDTCTGTLATLDDLITCVDDTAQEMADELLCIQFPTGWGPCPPDAS
ncbi:MAG: hypothetical protein ACREQL_06670 [Candidatus Binatia bacterium]